MPRFSVVISVFNKEKYIFSTLKSVIDQTFTDFEVVILNDGSTDNSEAEILKLKDERIRYFSEENRGAGAGRNYVIKKAKADYIALLDADDIWKPTYLEEQDDLITQLPNESVFATNSEFLKNKKIYKKDYSMEMTGSVQIVNFFTSSLKHSIINSSSTVIKKDVFEKIGFYNPSIISGQDTDLFVRIGLKYNIVFSPKILVQINQVPLSLSNRTKKLSQKVNFREYEKFEKTNYPLKVFLDLNRYSLCILAKLENNKKGFIDNYNKINLDNLSKQQRFLLKQNKRTLQSLLKLKNGLEKMGVRLTSFKG